MQQRCFWGDNQFIGFRYAMSTASNDHHQWIPCNPACLIECLLNDGRQIRRSLIPLPLFPGSATKTRGEVDASHWQSSIALKCYGLYWQMPMRWNLPRLVSELIALASDEISSTLNCRYAFVMVASLWNVHASEPHTHDLIAAIIYQFKIAAIYVHVTCLSFPKRQLHHLPLSPQLYSVPQVWSRV